MKERLTQHVLEEKRINYTKPKDEQNIPLKPDLI